MKNLNIPVKELDLVDFFTFYMGDSSDYVMSYLGTYRESMKMDEKSKKIKVSKILETQDAYMILSLYSYLINKGHMGFDSDGMTEAIVGCVMSCLGVRHPGVCKHEQLAYTFQTLKGYFIKQEQLLLLFDKITKIENLKIHPSMVWRAIMECEELQCDEVVDYYLSISERPDIDIGYLVEKYPQLRTPKYFEQIDLEKVHYSQKYMEMREFVDWKSKNTKRLTERIKFDLLKKGLDLTENQIASVIESFNYCEGV